jgi:hypothetical protein
LIEEKGIEYKDAFIASFFISASLEIFRQVFREKDMEAMIFLGQTP